MLWEAPERVTAHLLDQLSSECEMDFTTVWELRWSTKYSSELWKRLFGFCLEVARKVKNAIAATKPDLLGLLE